MTTIRNFPQSMIKAIALRFISTQVLHFICEFFGIYTPKTIFQVLLTLFFKRQNVQFYNSTFLCLINFAHICFISHVYLMTN